MAPIQGTTPLGSGIEHTGAMLTTADLPFDVRSQIVCFLNPQERRSLSLTSKTENMLAVRELLRGPFFQNLPAKDAFRTYFSEATGEEFPDTRTVVNWKQDMTHATQDEARQIGQQIAKILNATKLMLKHAAEDSAMAKDMELTLGERIKKEPQAYLTEIPTILDPFDPQQPEMLQKLCAEIHQHRLAGIATCGVLCYTDPLLNQRLKACTEDITTAEKLQEATDKIANILSSDTVQTTVQDLDIVGIIDNLFYFTIRSIPYDITSLTHIRRLKFTACKLLFVSDSIGNLTMLEELGLLCNCLTSLPPGIARLKRLQKLNLGQNCFHDVPSVICRLPALNQLNLSENKITALPASFEQLKLLQLGVINCRFLCEAPESIWSIPKLYISGVPLAYEHFFKTLSANKAFRDWYYKRTGEKFPECGEIAQMKLGNFGIYRTMKDGANIKKADEEVSRILTNLTNAINPYWDKMPETVRAFYGQELMREISPSRPDLVLACFEAIDKQPS